MALHTSGFSLNFSASFIPRIACGCSGSLSGTLPISCSSPAAFGFLGIESQLRGHGSTEVSYLNGVLQEVLPVGGAVLHPSHHSDELVVHVVDSQVDCGTLTCFHDLLLDLLAWFWRRLLRCVRDVSCRRLPACASDSRAISLLTGSKPERMIASGESSMMISMPVK
jgi:hypothetical protein